MASVFPDDVLHCPAHALPAGLRREVEVLRQLAEALPPDHCLFHAVDWHSVHRDRDRHGEVDVVVMNPAADLLLIEIKAGAIEETADELIKHYGEHAKSIDRQGRRTYGAMAGNLRRANLACHIGSALLLPDHVLVGPGTVLYPRERILDARDMGDAAAAGAKLLAMMPARGEAQADASQVEALRRFLLNQFQVDEAVDVLGGHLARMTQRLAEGLATWVPRIAAPQGAVRVCATAGSGKTQLALRLLAEAHAAGCATRYVCFNRLLADTMRARNGTGAHICTYHELAVDYARESGSPVLAFDKSSLDAAAEHYAAAAAGIAPAFELLVVDEGQDLKPEWFAALRASLRPGGRLYLLEDEDQRIYTDRAAITLPEAVVIQCPDNFRSPREVVRSINLFGLASRPIRAVGPWRGAAPEIAVYADDAALDAAVAAAVAEHLAHGHRPQDIVVLSYQGMGRSRLAQAGTIGHHPVRRPAQPEEVPQAAAADAIAIETLYRFKGHSAPAIVLAEIDFDAITEHERRKLLVGMTRARMALSLVMTQRAADALGEALTT